MLLKALGTSTLIAAVALGSFASWATGDGAATPEEVVDKVREAARYLADAGEPGLARFRGGGSAYVWKDTYVFVLDCAAGKLVGQPVTPERIGMDLAAIKDEAGKAYALEMCAAARRPEGGWVEYLRAKPGGGAPERKLSYVTAAEGTPYTVGAGVYDAGATVEELEAISARR
jgi:cytochrome c